MGYGGFHRRHGGREVEGGLEHHAANFGAVAGDPVAPWDGVGCPLVQQGENEVVLDRAGRQEAAGSLQHTRGVGGAFNRERHAR
jgi:hypothetical protein